MAMVKESRQRARYCEPREHLSEAADASEGLPSDFLPEATVYTLLCVCSRASFTSSR